MQIVLFSRENNATFHCAHSTCAKNYKTHLIDNQLGQENHSSSEYLLIENYSSLTNDDEKSAFADRKKEP